MSTRVFLIRHGATVQSAEDRYTGSMEVDLSEEGRAQARALGARLSKQPIEAFYCSPQGRARETAALIAAPHEIEPVQIPAFREISHGRWEAMTRSEVESAYADEYRKWEENPYAFTPLDGESGLSVVNRALPALLELVQRHEKKTIAIVSHKATIRLLICTFLGFDPRRYRDHLDQSPAALNILDFKDELNARLTVFNDTAHYAEPTGYVPAEPTRRLSPWWDKK